MKNYVTTVTTPYMLRENLESSDFYAGLIEAVQLEKNKLVRTQRFETASYLRDAEKALTTAKESYENGK